ncbi:hypothetical protein ACI780_18030 [Geodermatophilus sp. SYSU D00814]
MHPSRLRAALLGSAVLVAGCSTAVAGPAAPPDAGPLTDEVGRVQVDAAVERDVRLADIAATPDGGFVALLTGDLGAPPRSVLVELVPGDDGLTVGRTVQGAPFADLGEVHVAPDGTVVALAPVLPERGDAGSGDGGREQDLALAVLTPGADRPEVVRVAADADLGTPDSGSGVLSPDGATLSASLQWYVHGDTVNRLATIDVATGVVLASADLQVQTPGQAVARDVALRPDGGLAALVSVDRDAEGSVDGVVLATYDADLRPVGAPVELVEQQDSTGYALQVLSDGAVLVSVLAGDRETGSAQLVTVRDGAVVDSTPLPGPGIDLVLGPGEEHAYVQHGSPEDGVALSTVDLATGETVAEVPLCDDGIPAPVALADDGSALAAGVACLDGREYRDLAVLLG